MSYFLGIDLHSNNGYYGIVDENGNRVFKKRLPNDLPAIVDTLEPFKADLETVAVESTYNWYWLVDGLMSHGYPLCLANPAAMAQYDGLKDANDETDAFFIAELLRLGILPQGYIYPKEERPVRDLLRRRMRLVQQRTAHILSFKSLICRETGDQISTSNIRKLQEEDVSGLLEDEYLALAGTTNIAVIKFLTEKIRVMEKAAANRVKLKPEYELLLTAPGIGMIMGLTIMLETGDISRFANVGNYTSYCRGVEAKRTSNNKTKGKNNSKNGNRYLAWAYVETAQFMRRFCPEAQSFYQKKLAKTKECVAIKALASKISKACYFIMHDQVEFDVKKLFG